MGAGGKGGGWSLNENEFAGWKISKERTQSDCWEWDEATLPTTSSQGRGAGYLEMGGVVAQDDVIGEGHGPRGVWGITYVFC